MNDYLIAQEAMRGLLDLTQNPMEAFTKKGYTPAFEKIYQQLVPAFDAIERLYQSVQEPETMLSNMADEVISAAKQKVDSCKRRNQKESVLMGLNMQMAVFVFPAALHYKGTSSRPLVDMLLAKWKEAFPKTNLQAADVEFIQKGFKRKFCYITTAVCRTFRKPDDCYELTLLRRYRDGYLAGQPNGEEIIRRYYDVAPSIVKHIDRCPDSGKIYRRIWDEYIQPCIRLIEEGRNEECKELYIRMVETLQDQYFTA